MAKAASDSIIDRNCVVIPSPLKWSWLWWPRILETYVHRSVVTQYLSLVPCAAADDGYIFAVLGVVKHDTTTKKLSRFLSRVFLKRYVRHRAGQYLYQICH